MKPEECYKITSIGWNNLGSRLFVGLSNGDLKVIEVSKWIKNLIISK